jgi:hypothetical protein
MGSDKGGGDWSGEVSVSSALVLELLMPMSLGEAGGSAGRLGNSSSCKLIPYS